MTTDNAMKAYNYRERARKQLQSAVMKRLAMDVPEQDMENLTELIITMDKIQRDRDQVLARLAENILLGYMSEGTSGGKMKAY